jgi:hypothetical protein
MSLCAARILSYDGVVLADPVDVWIDRVSRAHGEEWYGSFDVSLDDQEVWRRTVCHMHFADGRIGEIMITGIAGSENIRCVFQGIESAVLRMLHCPRFPLPEPFCTHPRTPTRRRTQLDSLNL